MTWKTIRLEYKFTENIRMENKSTELQIIETLAENHIILVEYVLTQENAPPPHRNRNYFTKMYVTRHWSSCTIFFKKKKYFLAKLIFSLSESYSSGICTFQKVIVSEDFRIPPHPSRTNALKAIAVPSSVSCPGAERGEKFQMFS